MPMSMRCVLACVIALSVSLPAMAQEQQLPPLPQGCLTEALHTNDLQYRCS
jgi:hypothetical protein